MVHGVSPPSYKPDRRSDPVSITQINVLLLCFDKVSAFLKRDLTQLGVTLPCVYLKFYFLNPNLVANL